MANKRKSNRFSVFVKPTDDCYIDAYNSTTKNTPTDNIGLKVVNTDPGNTDLHVRALLRTTIVQGTDNSHQIPYFDKIVGCWLHLYEYNHATTPDVYVHELNNDLTKYFLEASCCWSHYKDNDAVDSIAGADWEDAGGDFEGTMIAHRRCATSPLWKYFDISNWVESKGLEDGSIISLLLKGAESGANADAAYFYSKTTTTTGTLPSSSWRGTYFSGTGAVYWEGLNTGIPLIPMFEIAYEDEIPDQPDDFKLTPEEDNPEKVNLEYSESSADDVQGYMLFATTDPQLKTFDSIKYLAYDGQSGNFTIGSTLTGGTSGATAIILYDNDAGSTGSLVLRTVNGTFQNNEAITDAATGAAVANGTLGDARAWGWVDAIDASNKYIYCVALQSNWPKDCWNGYKMIMINGKKKGQVYTVADTDASTGRITLTETITKSEFGYNDMFILVRGYGDIASVGDNFIFAVETNRGFYWESAPSDEYPVWIKDMSQFSTNTKYYFFVQAIDNLGMGERGGQSNQVEYVIPKIDNVKDVNIVAATDDDTGTSLLVYEELYPAVYMCGLNNTVTTTPGTSTTGLKDKIKLELLTGEHRYVLDTFVTTLTAEWSSGTTISVDLTEVPSDYFQVGQYVCIIDRDATPTVAYDIRLIAGVGDNSIVVDSAPGHTFTANRSQIYPVKKFAYHSYGAKTGIVKCRVINDEGFASDWQTPNTAPAPADRPGLFVLKGGPIVAEKDSTKVHFNMNTAVPKPLNATISSYVLDMDDGSGVLPYSDPIQTLSSYSSTGTKDAFGYMLDSGNIISPAFDFVMVYDVSEGTKYIDDTVDAYDAGTKDVPLGATGDYLYMGLTVPTNGVYLVLGDAFTDANPVIEYWTGSAWSALSITDNTSDLTSSGTLEWTRPDDWDTTDADTISTSVVTDTTQLYYFRLSVTDAGSIAFGNFTYIVPMSKDVNYIPITVTDPVIIDLDSTTVLQAGYEKHSESHPRRIYITEGVLASMVKQGRQLTVQWRMSGVAHHIGSNYLSGFDSSGEPVWSGAANTTGRFDDIQVLENIIANGRLCQVVDDAGNTHVGYLQYYSEPSNVEGGGFCEWEVEFIIDANR